MNPKSTQKESPIKIDLGGAVCIRERRSEPCWRGFAGASAPAGGLLAVSRIPTVSGSCCRVGWHVAYPQEPVLCTCARARASSERTGASSGQRGLAPGCGPRRAARAHTAPRGALRAASSTGTASPSARSASHTPPRRACVAPMTSGCWLAGFNTLSRAALAGGEDVAGGLRPAQRLGGA